MPTTPLALARCLLTRPAALFAALAALLASPLQAQDAPLENQLVIIRTGNEIKVLRVAKIEKKGDLSNLYEESGKKSLWQTALIVKIHPLFVASQSGSYTEDQANQAIAELEKIQQTFPQVKTLASEEIDLWKAMLSERQRVEQERKAKLEGDLQAFFSGAYEENFDYSKEALRAKIEQGEALMQAAPDKKADLEKFLSPWRQHLAYLDENRIRVNGVWTTREEIAQKEEAARLAEEKRIFAEISELEMPILVVPQTSVLLVLGFVILVLVSILYLFLQLASSRGGNLSFGGALLLLAGLALLGLYGYGGYLVFAAPSALAEIPGLFPAKEDPESLKPIQRVLYLSARPTHPKMAPGDLSPAVQDQALNAYARQHLKFTSTEPDQFFDMRRTGLAMRFEPNQVTLYEETSCLGKSMLIRYQISCVQNSKQIEFNKVEVRLGNAPLPGSMSTYLWTRFQTAVDTLLNGKNVHQTYQLNEIKAGVFVLAYAPRLVDRDMAKPLPGGPAKPSESPESAPAPETSAPAPAPTTSDTESPEEKAAEAPMN